MPEQRMLLPGERIVRTVNVAVIAFIGLLGASVQAADWPQWRGPQRNAISIEKGLLQQWPSQGPAKLWESQEVGGGYASVVVSQGLLFTIGQEGKEVVAVALDATSGKLRWKQTIGNTGRTPCSTPTVDGNRLYALDPDGNLVCLQTDSGRSRAPRRARAACSGSPALCRRVVDRRQGSMTLSTALR